MLPAKSLSNSQGCLHSGDTMHVLHGATVPAKAPPCPRLFKETDNPTPRHEAGERGETYVTILSGSSCMPGTVGVMRTDGVTSSSSCRKLEGSTSFYSPGLKTAAVTHRLTARLSEALLGKDRAWNTPPPPQQSEPPADGYIRKLEFGGLIAYAQEPLCSCLTAPLMVSARETIEDMISWETTEGSIRGQTFEDRPFESRQRSPSSLG